MAVTKEKTHVKKHISNILRKELKYGRFVSVVVDNSGVSSLLWVFHGGIGGSEQNHHLKRVCSMIESGGYESYTVIVTHDFPTEGFDSSLFAPSYVLKALRDETQFNRGVGGKSLNAIHKWCNEKYAELSVQDVKRALDMLMGYGVVVMSIAGTYWYRNDMREKMNAQGISFLPVRT
jgi:hypothetical protein